MNFSPPSPHQKIYLLGACAVLLIVFVYVVKNGVFHRDQIVSSASGIASSETVPVAVSDSENQKINQNKKPLIPPISSATSFSASISSSSKLTKQKSSVAPSPLDAVSASAYLVGNAATGQVYFSKNSTLVNGLASISKLFTAIVAEQNMDPNEVIQITPAMLAVYPNSYGVQLGEKFTLSDLLYGMLLQSNDNIAEGIAMAYTSSSTYISAPVGTSPSESTFIEKMNDLATVLGLSQTHFVDASGLDPGNVTDAQDLFSFAQYLYKNQTPLLGITTTYSYTVATTTDHLGHNFINIDPFVGDPHYIGGKTGRTDLGGETMLSIFNYQSADGTNYPIVVIVLHSDLSERQNDTSELYLQAINLINQNQKGL